MTLKYVVSWSWTFLKLLLLVFYYYLFSATDLELIDLLFLCVMCKVFVHVGMHVCTCICKGRLWLG
jgi:hypothetical protein